MLGNARPLTAGGPAPAPGPSYIDGGNEEGKKVPMTAPVATKIA